MISPLLIVVIIVFAMVTIAGYASVQ